MEIHILRTNNIHNICRICLEEREGMSCLYTSNKPNLMSVAELLEFYMSIRIDQDDGLPDLVCSLCESDVLQMCRVKLRLDNSQQCLQEYLKTLETDQEQPAAEALEVNDDVKTVIECSLEELELFSSFSDPEPTANASKLHICKKCKLCFPSRLQLSVHRKKYKHYMRKTVTCSKCKLSVPAQNYKSHFLKHSAELKCEFCLKKFSNKFNLKRHLFIHTNQTPYSCSVCRAKFARQDKLKRHLIAHDATDNKFEPRQRQNGGEEHLEKYKRTLSCETCSKTFALPSSLQTHMLLHTDDRVICSVCGKPYPNECKLQAHKLKVHQQKQTDRDKFLCDVCPKQYSTKGLLRQHLLDHLGVRNTYTCGICNKTFTQKGSLALHLKIHTGERPYVCHVCSRSFNKPYHLQRHSRIVHENIRRYSCPVCEKSFGVKQTLVIHMRLHSGEKPFSCSVCDKKFIDRGSLRKHFKIHLRTVDNF